jgi:hypothetical protein
MLAQAEVPPELTEGLLTRLDDFVLPFTAALVEPEQRWHTVEYMTGLLSKLDHKTGEGIAYLHDQERQGLQKFIGHVPWEHQPLLLTLSRQVGADLGAPDGVIVFDPSAFAKKGTKSVGVTRQWCGRLGKVENCQVGVYMAYVSRKEHTIVNTRLYLPKEWTKDCTRRKEAGVPKGVKFRTRHDLALEMLDEQGSLLPHAGSSVFKCEAEGFLSIWPGCLPGLSSPVRAPGDLRGRHPDQHPRPRQDRHRDQRDYRGGLAPRRRDHRV